MHKSLNTLTTADTDLREFGWSRFCAVYPFAAWVLWLLLAGTQLLAGKPAVGLLLLVLSGKWAYDCYWYWKHPYVQLGKDSIRINRSPLRRQVVYWECIEDVKELENRQLELLFYDQQVVTISLRALEFAQRNIFVTTLRNALCAFQTAHPDWDRAAMRDRSRARRLLQKAEKLCGTGRFHKAIPLLDEALQLYPECEGCYLNRGVALFSCGCLDESLADFVQARQLNPRLAVSYYYLALVNEKSGRNEEALKSYQDFLRYASPRYEPLAEAVRERIRQLQNPEQ